jgi:3-oxoacyl-[acyl-carrier protein] reductase
MALENKVALVTGGGRGVGAATAKLLAARGARVAVNYLSNAQAAGGVVTAIQADVRDAQQVARLVASVIDTYGFVLIDIDVNQHQWLLDYFA